MASYLSERAQYIRFWTDLTSQQRRFLNKVTEDMPLDRTAGLMNVHRKLWKGPGKAFGAVIIMLRLLLNTSVSVHSFQKAFAHHSDHIDTSQVNGSLTMMTHDMLVICESSFVEGKGKHETCVKLKMSRLHAYRFVCAIEASINCTLATISMLSVIGYVVCRQRDLPFRRPYFFFFLPKIASKTSAISPLQIMGVARLRSLFGRNEMIMWFDMVWMSLCPSRKMLRREVVGAGGKGYLHASRTETKDFEDLNYVHDEEHPTDCAGIWHFLWLVVAGTVCIGLVVFAIQALLVKLTLLHFATVRTWYHWSPQEWFVFIGLVNQLAGLCFVDEIEMHRLLLLKFGGVNSMWGRSASLLCADYFALLAHKIDDGEAYGNLSKCYVMMCTIGSHDVQELFLSREREEQLDGVRNQRLRLLEDTYILKGRAFEISIDRILSQKTEELERAQLRLEQFKALPHEAKLQQSALKLQSVWRSRSARLMMAGGGGVEGQKEVVEKIYERNRQVQDQLGFGNSGGDNTRTLLNDAAKTDNQQNLKSKNHGFSLKSMAEFMTIVKPRLDYLYAKRDEIIGEKENGYIATDGSSDVAARFALAAVLQEEVQDMEKSSRNWFQGDFNQIEQSVIPSVIHVGGADIRLTSPTTRASRTRPSTNEENEAYTLLEHDE